MRQTMRCGNDHARAFVADNEAATVSNPDDSLCPVHCASFCLFLRPVLPHLTDTTALPLASHFRQRSRGSRSSTGKCGGSRNPCVDLTGGISDALDLDEVARPEV